MTDYEYQPLDVQSSAFRLFRLKKGDSVKTEGEIFHSVISNHSAVPYEALSYTWGSTELVECIEVKGRSLWITENLYSALQCLRYTNQDRVFWIDQICINQSDMEERSQQVLNMGNIFGFATRVVFWLGKPTADTVLLIGSLNKLEKRIVALLMKGTLTGPSKWKMLWSSIQQKEESQSSNWLIRRQEGLKVLLRRPWFERVWILQEIMRAQSAIVCSGSFTVASHIFALSPSLLGVKLDSHVQSVLDLVPRPYGTESQHLREKASLDHLLMEFHASKATDKRDMIFALVGMSSEPLDHKFLRPDYTKSIHKVIHNTTVRTTYFISPMSKATVTETIRITTKLDSISCPRDASLFLLEDPQVKLSEGQYRLCDEVDHLQLKLNQIEFVGQQYHDSIRIISWPKSQQNFKFIVISRRRGALILAGQNRCRYLFTLLADNISNDKQGLLRDTLLLASEDGCLETVQLLLENGAYINSRGVRQGTALQAASYHGQLSVVRLLINMGANVNVRDSTYGGALQAAAEGGSVEIAKLLIENGADVNYQEGRRGTALHEASRRGNWEIVQLLIDKGADVDATAGPDETPLQAASREGHLETVKLLVSHGANVNIRVKGHDSVLPMAKNGYHLGVEYFLLDHGAESPNEEWSKRGHRRIGTSTSEPFNSPEIIEV